VHGRRWQIYGPDKEGIALCDRHSKIDNLTDEEIIYLSVSGTAARRIRLKSNRMSGGVQRAAMIDLPSLQAGKHIFINIRRLPYELQRIEQLFIAVERAILNRKEPIFQEMAYLLKNHAEKRRKNVARDQEWKGQGQVIFQQVCQAYRMLGNANVSDGLVFKDYKPPREAGQAGLLFVEWEESLKGAVFGRSSGTRNQVEAQLNVRIRFEVGTDERRK